MMEIGLDEVLVDMLNGVLKLNDFVGIWMF